MRPLGEVTINHDTKRRPVKEGDRVPGPYPYYGASGVVDFVDGYLFDGEHLLIAEDGENLRTRKTPIAFRATGKFWVNNHAHIVEGNSLARTRYIEYALQAADISPYLSGAVMPKLTQRNLNKILIPCPMLAVQDAVVALIGPIDDRIDLLRQTNATLEAIAQALFKSWFVDFDPVRAKMEGRAPGGMDETTAALFPDQFEDSQGGQTPIGWAFSTLAELADLNRRTWSTRRAPAEISYIDLTSLKANVFEPPLRVAFSEAPSRARRELCAGDTVVATVRPGNRSFGFIVDAPSGLTGSTGFAVLSPRQTGHAAFVYLCCTAEENIDRLASLADGGAYPAVRPDLVINTPCVLPPDQLMRAFDSVVKPLLEAVHANSMHAQTLAMVRDTLLPRLISGKLRLPESKELVVEALA